MHLLKLLRRTGAALISMPALYSAAHAQVVHDAEFYVLQAQHGDRWAVEDTEIDEKLAALREKFGTPPNIVHIMWDDSAVGDVGIPHIQKIRGYETPNINMLASEGLNMMRMYTEPSCTPSRAAVMTGRHAVRNGMFNVGFPYEYGGLAAEEVTIAEVLSEVGYATAFFGKGHLGDIEESYMTNQGFDEALWTPYNQVPSMYTPQAEISGAISGMYPDQMPEDPYDMDRGWAPDGYVYALEGKKGGPVREFGTPPNVEDYLKIDSEGEKRTLAFINKNAEKKKAVLHCVLAEYHPASRIPRPGDRQPWISHGRPGAVRSVYRPVDGRIEFAENFRNTLVVLMADNGPFTHNGPPGSTETLFTGGKGDSTEGGVRVPALAWWPGMIDPGQISGDIIHETDLFTTFARLAGATDYIPTDRIIDGVDQTALLLNGDTHSRRDYNFIYTGDILAATVKGRFKRRWVGELPGLSGAAFYDLYQDPREVSPKMLPYFPTKGMFNIMKVRHELFKKKYPDASQARGMPLTGIENARPETIAASQPRFDPSKVPFDPAEFIDQLPGWENVDDKWGTSE